MTELHKSKHILQFFCENFLASIMDHFTLYYTQICFILIKEWRGLFDQSNFLPIQFGKAIHANTQNISETFNEP